MWLRKTLPLPDGNADLAPIKTNTWNPTEASCLQDLWNSEDGVGGLSSSIFKYKSDCVGAKPYNNHQEADFKWNSSPAPQSLQQSSGKDRK